MRIARLLPAAIAALGLCAATRSSAQIDPKFDPSKLGDCPLDELVPWQRLDWAVMTALVERGHSGHLHSPAVTHLNYGHQRMTRSLVMA